MTIECYRNNMLQEAFMAGGEGGSGGRKAITKTTVKSTCRNTSMYTSAYTDNYRQFLIKIKYDWSDYNGVAFSTDLLEWGRKFFGFLG